MSVKLQVGLAAAMALLLATTTALAAGRNPNPGVLPVNARAHGKSYGEWGAAWWTALFSIPVMNNDHPLFSGGAFGGEKGVVFLAATGGGVTVDITIPTETTLFVPVLNTECSVVEGPPFHGDNEEELRACANGFLDHTSGVFASIDGVAVSNLESYRVESPLFQFGPLPEDNVLGVPAGTTSLSVDAGIYLLVAPLKVGTHTIVVQGTFDDLNFTVDTTFHITVVE